jgi:hypothetical protein
VWSTRQRAVSFACADRSLIPCFVQGSFSVFPLSEDTCSARVRLRKTRSRRADTRGAL